MTQKIKQIIIGTVVIIIAFVGFRMFFSKSEPADATLITEQASNPEFIDGQIILSLLDKLDKVVLDDTVFSNEIFVSLVSFDRELDGQIIERKNPFLPIGVENSAIVLPVKGTSTVPKR
jgi:hypothetical protein